MSQKLMQWRNAPGFGEKHLYVCDRDCQQLQNRASHNASDVTYPTLYRLAMSVGYVTSCWWESMPIEKAAYLQINQPLAVMPGPKYHEGLNKLLQEKIPLRSFNDSAAFSKLKAKAEKAIANLSF